MTRPRKVFLAHAREDKNVVRGLYKQIKQRGFNPWLDEEDLIPGQIWSSAIQMAIREADAFIACLSQNSVKKEGFVQREFRLALAAFSERPPDSIYFLPVRLDNCEVPNLQIPNVGLDIRDIHCVDLWQEDGLDKLFKALERVLPEKQLGLQEQSERKKQLERRLGTWLEQQGLAKQEGEETVGAFLTRVSSNPRVGVLAFRDNAFLEWLHEECIALGDPASASRVAHLQNPAQAWRIYEGASLGRSTSDHRTPAGALQSSQRITYILGLHVGDETTSTMAVNLLSKHKNSRAFKVEIGRSSCFPTAIGYHDIHGPLIGSDAFIVDGIKKIFTGYEILDMGGDKKEDALERCSASIDYFKYIKRGIFLSPYGFTEDNTALCIDFPSNWGAGEVETLTNLLSEVGFREVYCVPKHRAALHCGIESGDIFVTLGELKGTSFVIDIGSSKVDCTAFALQPTSESVRFSSDVSGSLIDKLIFRDTLNDHKRKDQLTDIFLKQAAMRNRCELACRDVKEALFNNRSSTPSRTVELIPGELFFTVRLDMPRMERILSQLLTVLEDMRPLFGASLPHLPSTTWPEALETLLQRANTVVGEPDIILVTGGARMDFVKPLCMKHFPKAKYTGSVEPEYSIAAGLVYWGRRTLSIGGDGR